MKRLFIISILALLNLNLWAQNTMTVHTENYNDEYLISETDSMYFNEDSDVIYFQLVNDLVSYYTDDIDSVSFDISTDNTIFITYDQQVVSIINPLEDLGVDIEVDGADVTVIAEADIKDINYVLSGNTEEGMFKIYSDKRFNLLLNGVDIYNSDWPAINIQSDKKCRLNLVYGSINILTDGTDYAAAAVNANNEEEDQKATLFSEGDLEFIGGGSLTVNSFGSDQHAIRSDDELIISEGHLLISSAAKDGLHGKNGFFMSGGEVSIEAVDGDGIDAGNDIFEMLAGVLNITSTQNDVKAMKSDTSMYLLGGSIHLNLQGDQSKGISSDYELIIDNMEINIETSGNAVLESSGSGYDASYCTAIDGGTEISIYNALIEIESNGEAGRGFSCDGNMLIDNSDILIINTGDGDLYTNEDGDDDAYHGTCFKVDGDMEILSGNIELSNSGDGGKGISIDGNLSIGDDTNIPSLNVTTTGSSIVIQQGGGGGGPGGGSGDYDEAKAITCDAEVTINNGEIIIESADDGIKADEAITIENGNLQVLGSVEALEAPYITVNNGYLELHSEDDGFNATFGNGGEGDDGSLLQINGGYTMINATGGDAVDSNGDFEINGGELIVHGPQSAPEVGMDVNGDKRIDGGFLIISGTSSNMTEGASSSSNQISLLLRTTQALSANTLFHIEDSEGNHIVTFAPQRSYYSIVFSSSDLQNGTSYNVYSGGTCTGEEEDGLYQGGIYSGGNLETSFTISQTVTTVWF